MLRARAVNFVSTTGAYLREKLFPSLGIAEEVARKANDDTLANLPGTVDLVLRPVSEILHLPGFDFVGPAPAQIQCVSVFTAAVVVGSKQVDVAKRLIAFLSSDEALAVSKKHGLESAGRK